MRALRKITETYLHARASIGFFFSLLFFVSLLCVAPIQAIEHQPPLTKNNMPNLGIQKTPTKNIQPQVDADKIGVRYRDHFDGALYSLIPQYSKTTGLSLGASLAVPLNEDMALGMLLSLGSARKELLLNAGFSPTEKQQLILSLSQLRQKLNFDFSSGRERVNIVQNNGAFSYQYLIGKQWLNSAEFNGYVSHTDSLCLGEKAYVVDNDLLYELWKDPRQIVGGQVRGLQGRLIFMPSTQSTLKFGFGRERLVYSYFTGKDTTDRLTTNTELQQRFSHGVDLKMVANTAAAQNYYSLGLGHHSKNGQRWAIDLVTIRGHKDTSNDNQIRLNYSKKLEGTPAARALHPLSQTSKAAAAPENQTAKRPWASPLLQQVGQRPNFLPAQVIAKIDPTAVSTRQISVNKAELPDDAVVDTDTAIVTVPLNVAVIDIASITRNGGSFSNTGQYLLSEENLIIDPKVLIVPAIGSPDTYVVTINNVGGGTSIVTITVSHGSIRIDSVVINNASTLDPTFSSFNDISKTYGNAPFNLTAPSSNSSGSFSYVSSNTNVATISGNTITIVGVGSTTITATQAASGRYREATTTAILTVGGATPTLGSFNDMSKTYGNAPFNLTAPSSNSSGSFSYVSSNTNVATISGKTITIVGIGSTAITATQAAAGNYSATTTTATLTVDGTPPTLGSFNDLNKTYGNAPFNLTAPSSNSGGTFSYSSSNTAVATISGSTVTIVGVGTTTITATEAAAGNYSATTTAATLTVSGATPTLGSFNDLNKTYGNAPFDLTAPSSNSSGSFSYSSSNTAVATISGRTVIIAGVGTTTITATQAADGNYSATTTTATLSVGGATPTLGSFNDISKTYGNAPFSLTAPSSNSSGTFSYSSSNTAVATISGSTVTIVGAGTTTITATQAAAGNYLSTSTTNTLSVAQATPTIASISDIQLNSSDYVGLCIGTEDSCGAVAGFLVVAEPSSNSAGHFTLLSSTNTAVMDGAGYQSYGPGYYLASNFNNTFLLDGLAVSPIESTITLTQAATTNYTSGTISFKVTIDPVTNTDGSLINCLNNGVLIRPADNIYACECQPGFTGVQCDQVNLFEA